MANHTGSTVIGSAAGVSAFGSLAEYICAIERARSRALLGRDMEVLWRLHAPEYQLITPPGRTYTRERYLREIESRELSYLQWKASGQMDARASETMATVRYQVILELDSGNGRGTPFLCWHTDMYELRDQIWQAVWSQATAIR